MGVGIGPDGLRGLHPSLDQVDLAKRRLLRILEALRNEIRAGLPIVVIEPACASVFRDEIAESVPGQRGHQTALQPP